MATKPTQNEYVRGLDLLCDLFGFTDQDIWKIEIVATVKDAPEVTVYHKGICKGSGELYEEVKRWQIVRKVLADGDSV